MQPRWKTSATIAAVGPVSSAGRASVVIAPGYGALARKAL
ncbi:Uncharacterised protein [Mycobacteroides abscessus]|nr:Uncharacterised protein [Mycobacteroides abscessus]